MAKKLISTNYEFDAANRTLTLEGNVHFETLLLITNVTDNEILYNFADPTAGVASVVYIHDSESTIITFTKDTTSMSNTDKIQIFVDDHGQEIKPTEDLIDPVGKMRVSNPGNLIDTDFEYGLQSTKWETLQTVKNVPTVYSTSGDTPVENLVSVETIAGAKQVKISTSTPHGLSLGDPVSVQGVTDYQAQGYFIISGVPDSVTFYYELDVDATTTGDISGSYTTIIAAKFFEGSSLGLDSSDGAITDGLTPSTLTIHTPSTHGLQPGTKLYLRNSVGPKDLVITDPTATAPDDRPYVDTTPFFTTSQNLDVSNSTGRGGYLDSPVVAYDWELTHTLYLDNTIIDTGLDRITWAEHGLQDGWPLLYNTPQRDIHSTVGFGLNDGTVVFTKRIDDQNIEIYTDEALTNKVNITAIDISYGLPRLGLLYKIYRSSGGARYTDFGANAGGTGTANSNATQITGSSVTSRTTWYINLTVMFGFNPTSAIVNFMTMGGDVNSSGENVDFRFENSSGGGVFTYNNVYSPGNQSAAYGTTRNGPSNLDVSNIIYTSGGNTYLRLSATCATSVGTFVYGGDRYRFNLNITASKPIEAADYLRGGGDLVDATYGIGGIEPDRIIAFQELSPGSGGTDSGESFSYRANTRTKGRYGTTNTPYSNTLSSTPTGNGRFDVNYSQSGTWNASSTDQIFYGFVSLLSSDRNTIYYPNHGITSATSIQLQVDATAYANGERFAFANSSGDITTVPDQVVGVTATQVNSNVLRVELSQSPNTDDFTNTPSVFSIVRNIENEFYNTIYVANHKITGSDQGEYTIASGGTPIGGLTSGTTYQLSRINDSRLLVTETSNTVASATTAAVGANNTNSVTSQFFDIETPLGIAPSSASILEVQYRGNFNDTDEYVRITFADGTDYYIGQINGVRSSTFQTEATFATKDITSLLTTQGGNLGFTVDIDPSGEIGRPPRGMTNRWEIRFVVSASSGTVVLSVGGSGVQTFSIDSVIGAYDGVYNIQSIPNPDRFTLTSDFTIPVREYPFTSAEIAGNVITFAFEHNFTTGEKVTYDPNGNTAIITLDPTDNPNNEFYAIAINKNSMSLSDSYTNAIDGFELTLTTQAGAHKINSNSVQKSIKGNGTVAGENGSNAITGSGTKFLSLFKRFDIIYIQTASKITAYEISGVTTDENLTLFEDLDQDLVDVEYFYNSQFTLRPDGYSLHKPFDGGVDITAGTSPDSKIVRQTRKYFRYQSGKGIQTSFAANFNPPKIVSYLIQANGTTATVQTQEAHNFEVGDQVKIDGAEVSVGSNTYNGTFNVSAVNGPFEFEYEMASIPQQVKAAGFPTYVRASWIDSAVRAGMFDDQNGFFYEYDGQELYAVRRSSTLQVAGYVSSTRGSSIIRGSNTSFTTQLASNDFVVIRGQSYQVVEVSSDSRLVVQPPYRGVSSNNVKMTKTVDTKTRQADWSIDPCDGTGKFGFVLNINKIQMAYMDYSWYGAGKIRYGFKDQNGHIIYVHEYKHNNRLDESYFRSGNLPARYEINNGPNASHSPTLFHFGTSIIMDGRFDDDKAYLFTGTSKPFAFTNGSSTTFNSSGASTFNVITLNGQRVWVYAIPTDANTAASTVVGSQISEAAGTLDGGAYVAQVKVDGANSVIYTSYPASQTEPGGANFPTINSNTTFTLGETDPIPLDTPIPLLSLRLAPSVDSGLTGAVGEREIINRMQLQLKQAGITSNQDVEVFLILNSQPSREAFEDADNPSLSEIISHNAGDTLINGTTILATKSSAGSLNIDLSALTDMGNSIQGGDGIFPAGPDLLTLAVQPQSTTGITGSTPFVVTGKISWAESQA